MDKWFKICFVLLFNAALNETKPNKKVRTGSSSALYFFGGGASGYGRGVESLPLGPEQGPNYCSLFFPSGP